MLYSIYCIYVYTLLEDNFPFLSYAFYALFPFHASPKEVW